ncbi:MAG TPA: YfhO family protein, partial [Urbifossiella sp.]
VLLPFSMAPNVGDTFDIEETMGSGATIQTEYDRMRSHPLLLNVRFIVRPASASEPGAIYQDSAWKIYENPDAVPRAWLVHQTTVEPVDSNLWNRLPASGAEARQLALLAEPLESSLDAAPPATDAEHANYGRPGAGQLEVDVHSTGRALLVLSELFYPGWKAEVNGRPVKILQVDGALRGVVVPRGDSRVSMHYIPVSFYAGLTLTIAAFLCGGFAGFKLKRAL